MITIDGFYYAVVSFVFNVTSPVMAASIVGNEFSNEIDIAAIKISMEELRKHKHVFYQHIHSGGIDQLHFDWGPL